MAVHQLTEAPSSFQSYHYAWLSSHPERDAAWLKRKLEEGFQVHHVDGDHYNDDPSNLILLDGVDHLRLHGVNIEAGIKAWREQQTKRAGYAEERASIYSAKLEFSGTWVSFAAHFHGGVKPTDKGWNDIGTALANRARRHAKDNGLQWPI